MDLVKFVYTKPDSSYKYFMGIDACREKNDYAFCVMRKDGEVMEFGHTHDEKAFKKEVERVANFYNILPNQILKETP